MFDLQPVAQSLRPVLDGLVFVHLSAVVHEQTAAAVGPVAVLTRRAVAALVVQLAALAALFGAAVVIVPE